MNQGIDEIQNLFQDRENRELLLHGKWGIEKEALRITREGELALTPHPAVFGDKSENPFIKTDFSESQVEMVTPALDSIEEADEYLKYLHSVVERGIGDELLWPLSMPGLLPPDEVIPVARFNNTDDGRKNEIYRSGLALRYGKRMQMISGIHYNFSFSMKLMELMHGKLAPDTEISSYINDTYFAVARNFLRHRWLLLYLFGASPASQGNTTGYATTLRMSSSGYDGAGKTRYSVSHNSLAEYILDLTRILATRDPHYTGLGVFRDGRQVQLNDNILQSENEFYSPLRFKRIGEKGRSQLENLAEDGVQYIELRIFDLNPFYVTGISVEQMYFIHLFILFCLFERSDSLSYNEQGIADRNAQLVASEGRKPGLVLNDCRGAFSIRNRGKEILEKMGIIARFLDEVNGDNKYAGSLEQQQMALNNPELLPSSWIAREMNRYEENHEMFGLKRAFENRYYFCIDEYMSSTRLFSHEENNTSVCSSPLP